MTIREATVDEHPAILNLYRVCGYSGGIAGQDLIVIALNQNDIVGAVRICLENGINVLRGMQIHPAFRHQQIGSYMLKFLSENKDLRNCYCLPYNHLKSFYGRIGFKEIKQIDAPDFLVERLNNYIKSGHYHIIIMKRL
jgi:N-acetylglutamate synthase-like GNAT family acetyltransferase